MIAILLTILFISLGLKDVYTILYFYSYQEYIAENLCVNKNIPQTTCSGKCFLINELEENKSGQEENLPIKRIIDHFEINLLRTDVSFQNILIKPTRSKATWAFKDLKYPSEFTSSLLRPPQVSLSYNLT